MYVLISGVFRIFEIPKKTKMENRPSRHHGFRRAVYCSGLRATIPRPY